MHCNFTILPNFPVFPNVYSLKGGCWKDNKAVFQSYLTKVNIQQLGSILISYSRSNFLACAEQNIQASKFIYDVILKYRSYKLRTTRFIEMLTAESRGISRDCSTLLISPQIQYRSPPQSYLLSSHKYNRILTLIMTHEHNDNTLK